MVCFKPLPHLYFDAFEEHGFDYKHRPGETINLEAYECAHCRSSDRDRMYALYLAHRLGGRDVSGLTLLEIAPTPCLSTHIRKHYPLDYRTADRDSPWADDHVDITDMNIYPSSSTDVIICSHVLEHVPNDIKAMSELYRGMKPGGWGIIMVPIDLSLEEIDEAPALCDEAERWRRFGQGDHVRMYSKTGFVSRLSDAGFHVEQLQCEDYIPDDPARFGITQGSILYIANKPMNP